MKEPELITATQEELDEILSLAKTTFPERQYRLLEGVLATFVYVMLKLQNAKTSIKRFQRMLFGHSTEHKRDVLKRTAAADDSQVQDGAQAQPQMPATVPVPAPGTRRPGHGRNAAQAYSGALQSSSACPPSWSQASAARSATRAVSTTRLPDPSSR